MDRKMEQEIGKVLERRLRISVLNERKKWLETEIAKIGKELKKLTGRGRRKKTKPRPKKRPKQRKKTKPKKKKKVARKRKRKGPSVRELAINIFRARRRPMHITELAKAMIKKGYRPARKEFHRTVDTILRANKKIFRKVKPGTFALRKKK